MPSSDSNEPQRSSSEYGLVGVGEEKIPPVSMAPHEMERMKKRLTASGINVRKATSNGRLAAKLLFLEDSDSRLCYNPSKKKGGDNSIAVVDVWRIDLGDDARQIFNTKKVKLELDEGDDGRLMAITTRSEQVWVLVCDSTEERNVLSQTIAVMVSGQRAVSGVNMLQNRIIRVWIQADNDQSGSIDVEELIKVLPENGFNMDVNMVKQYFDEYDADGSGTLEFDEFARLFESLVIRPELDPIFEAFAVAQHMDAKGLQRFFTEAQGDSVTISVARRRLELMARSRGTESLTAADFFSYLLNPTANSWINPRHLDVYQDMTQPLHHYFIMSSHNSALDGDQLTSKASSEWLGQVLRQGYRAIELEVFDGPTSTPVIGRCYSRCTPCASLRILEAIRDNAFVTSPYPLIIMLEMHTSNLQTETFARQLVSVFGDTIYTRREAAATDYQRFSPNDLKQRILFMLGQHDDVCHDPFATHGKTIEGSYEMTVLRDRQGHAIVSPPCEVLDQLVTLQSSTNVGFGDVRPPSTVFQVSEPLLNTILEQKLFKAIDLNRRMFTRSYPVNADSSNDYPMTGFQTGTQLACVNAQSCDDHLRVYEAVFRRNGRAGYLLKPLYMRSAKARPNNQAYLLTVVVVMGVQIPRPRSVDPTEIIDPLVTVTLHGGAGSNEGASTTFCTRVVEDNGFCPYFGESFEFRFRAIDQALLTLSILHAADGDPIAIGDATVPVSSLRVGYRAVGLTDSSNGTPLEFATLLVHVSLRELHAHVPPTTLPQPQQLQAM